jgi:hypothetical protein
MNRHARKHASALWLAGALLTLSAPLAAQNVLLDQGTFRVTVRGQEPGTETFTIEQIGAGADMHLLSSGRLELGGTLVTAKVYTTPQKAFYHYDGRSVAGTDSTHVDITQAGRRLQAHIVSSAGDQEREMRARDGAILLEGNLAHLYYFAASLEPGSTAPVVIPRGSEQATLALVSEVPETLTVGGQDIQARRLRLTLDGAERTIWLDSAGRVLRVEIPSLAYLAERVRPPA